MPGGPGLWRADGRARPALLGARRRSAGPTGHRGLWRYGSFRAHGTTGRGRRVSAASPGPCRRHTLVVTCQPCPSHCLAHSRLRRWRAFATAPWPSGSRPSNGFPEPSSPAMVKGTLVHSALERLFWFHERGDRSESVGLAELGAAWDELQSDPEFVSLGLSGDQAPGIPGRRRHPGPELLPPRGSRPGSRRRDGAHPRCRGGRCPPPGDHRPARPHRGRRVGSDRLQDGPGPRRLTSSRSWWACTSMPCCASKCSASGRPGGSSICGNRRRSLPSLPIRPSAGTGSGPPPSGPPSSAPAETRTSGPKTSALCTHCHFQPFCPAFGGDPALAAPTLLGPPVAHLGAA